MRDTQLPKEFEGLSQEDAVAFWGKHGCVKIYSSKFQKVVGLAKNEAIANSIREKGFLAFTIEDIRELKGFKDEEIKVMVEAMEIFNGKFQSKEREKDGIENEVKGRSGDGPQRNRNVKA